MNKKSDTVTPLGYETDSRSNGTAPEPKPPEPTHPPRLVYRWLAHRWPAYRWLALLAAAIVLAGAVAGVGVGFLLPATHAARAEVLYPITEELPTGFLREDRNLTTQLVVMRSRAVLGPAAAAEELPLAQLEEQVTISLLDSSEIIRIEVRDPSPAMATRLVDHIAQTYLALAQTSPESDALRYVESELAEAETALAEARQQRSDLLEQQEELGDDELSVQIDAAAAEISDHRTRARALRQERDDIQIIERAAPTAELITQPYALGSPVNPGPVVLAAAGASTGVVVAACVVAFLVRRRIRG